MTTTNALTIGKSLIATIIHNMPNIGAVQRRFILHILTLCLSMRGRFNYMQMSREGLYNEQTYRNQFNKKFDFLSFNIELVKLYSSENIAIAFDPSFISKSGKHTPQMGYFYSGCAGQHKTGLEIGGFAAIDIEKNTAYHLLAEQSPKAIRDRINENTSLLDHYVDLLNNHAASFKQMSSVVVADAYFAKNKYVTAVLNNKMHLVSRLRDDSNMNYLYNGPKSTQKGRPRKYSGKVNWKSIDKRVFRLKHTTKHYRLYTAVLHSVAFKRTVKVVYLELLNKKGEIAGYKILFTTKLDMGASRILQIYKGRFQIEFLYRDAKQYGGLEHCQSRNKVKLHYHFNTSLTSINIGKLTHERKTADNEAKSISIFDIKAELSNINFAERLFAKLELHTNFIKNTEVINFIRNFGKRAA